MLIKCCISAVHAVAGYQDYFIQVDHNSKLYAKNTKLLISSFFFCFFFVYQAANRDSISLLLRVYKRCGSSFVSEREQKNMDPFCSVRLV